MKDVKISFNAEIKEGTEETLKKIITHHIDSLINFQEFPEINMVYDAKIENLPEDESTTRDKIYREVWKEHVMEDIRSHAEDMEVELSNDDIDDIAERYVYNGDYECNLSYWQNIENLIYTKIKS